MRHQKSGRKLKRTSTHRKSLLNNLATALFEHKKVFTTEAKAKELRPFAESLITKAKNALKREKQGLLPEGHKVDIHNRRIVGRVIRSKAVLQELFDTIAPMVEERQGGYSRIIKTGFRRGDGGRTAIIELVDWSAPQDGAVSKKSKRKAAGKGKKAEEVHAPVKAEKAPKAKKEKKQAAEVTNAVAEEPIAAPIKFDEPVIDVAEVSETVVEEVAEVADEAPVDEEVVAEMKETVVEEVAEAAEEAPAPEETAAEEKEEDKA